ncbi:MAG TPA: ATP synthase A1 subunit C [Thermoplasmata archaeon]|nr:ATP synthase A1 subunit C [Thermoplasmata archaeon]
MRRKSEAPEGLDLVLERYRRVRDQIPYDSGNYPYVTARVRAKRAALLPADVYGRLLQMDIPEIARFLGEREYKAEMLELGGRYSGVDLIEAATSRNLAKTYNAIYDFCEGHLKAIVGLYLDRYDLQNVKTIVRGKTYGASAGEVEDDLVAAGSFPLEYLRELSETATLDETFDRLEDTIYAQALAGLGAKASDVTNWSAWEDRVSRIYYGELLRSIPPSTEANRLMRQFVEREIDIVNLKTLLRVWAAKAIFEREIFLPGGFEMTVEELESMVRLDQAALMQRLSAYSFYDDISADLERVQATGVGALLRKVEKVHLIGAARYSHLHPLSILPILDFIVRKDREVQNIRLIARGKESGLPLDVIRGLLVV